MNEYELKARVREQEVLLGDGYSIELLDRLKDTQAKLLAIIKRKETLLHCDLRDFGYEAPAVNPVGEVVQGGVFGGTRGNVLY